MARSILIIEDEETLADNLRVYLSRRGWEVHVANDGEEGLRKHEKLRPDVVLTDYALSGMSGLEVTRRVLAIDPLVIVIMMSGSGDAAVAEAAKRMGAYEYVVKPMAMEALLSLLDEALR